MLKIGFIEPSNDYLFDPFRGDPFTHFHILTILENTFGDTISATLIDLRGVKREMAVFHIPECDIYLHSVYTLDYNEQISIVANLKAAYPKAIHIAGGPHIASFPEENKKIFNALIIGEGEKIIVQAIQDVIDARLKPVYRQYGPIDINEYPHWNRKFLPKSVTARKNMMSLRKKSGYENLFGTTVMFSRGCPYSCHFCALRQDRDNAPGIRYRSPTHVNAEIEYLKREYGIQGIVLQDEIGIPLRREQAIEHLEAIGKNDILWRGQCRVDGITPELAKLARQSGCIAMGMGLESVHQASLEIINKRIQVAQARETIRLFKENDIEVRIYIIIGLPAEPEDIVEKTWAFIQETDPDMVTLSLFTVRPGTEIWNHPEKFGIEKLDTNWDHMMHMFGRYEDEKPTLSFAYAKETRWGKSLTNDRIIANYLELQALLKERNIGTAYYKK